MKKKIKGFGFYLIIILILLAVISYLTDQRSPEKVTYSEIYDYFQNEQVRAFTLRGDELIAELKDGTVIEYQVPTQQQDVFQRDLGALIVEQNEAGIIEEYDYLEPASVPWWASFIPYIFLIVIFALFWYFMVNKQDGAGGRGAMSFGKARAKLASNDKNKVTFDDVAGADEEKAELQEIVEFLKHPQKFVEIGARIPKGVLLVGPPGTGKTLIAKAVAGEAGVPFLSISGSDFVELYVGVGASRVRDLFEQAKKSAPAIIFIDEIDAVGRHRGAGLGGGHDEREQTLNQLLVEMDGFGANEGVIIIAATNRPDILDPALLRPGRFDRQVYVGVPDIKGREAILKVHARKKPFDPDVNFLDIAKSTAGFTGADLENLLNEAALLAARRNKKLISTEEIEQSFLKVIMGTEKKSRVMNEKEKKLTAYHEAGHAITTRLLPSLDPVHQISIIPRGRAGGFTMSLPKEDKFYSSKTEMLDNLVTLLGGRMAEKLVMDDISTGASNDIERATKIARSMVTKYGMSDKMGPICYGENHDEVFLGRDMGTNKVVSEVVAAQIDEEVKRIIDNAYERCEELLSTHRPQLERVAEYLIRNETMDGETFEKLFQGEEVEEKSSTLKLFREEPSPAEQTQQAAVPPATDEQNGPMGPGDSASTVPDTSPEETGSETAVEEKTDGPSDVIGEEPADAASAQGDTPSQQDDPAQEQTDEPSADPEKEQAADGESAQPKDSDE